MLKNVSIEQIKPGCHIRNTMVDGVNLNKYLISTSSLVINSLALHSTGDNNLSGANNTASGGVSTASLSTEE